MDNLALERRLPFEMVNATAINEIRANAATP
jgi:hypothetical protein